MRTPSTLTVETIHEAAASLRDPNNPTDRKVWIADLYQVAAPRSMSEAAFKSWMLERHLDRSIELSRYDLSDEPDLSRASEIIYLNASWHRMVAY